MYSTAVLTALPKTDLHCHLDGSLRLETLIELSRDRGLPLPSDTPDGLRALVFKDSYRDLADYLHGFSFTSRVLDDAESLERVAYELGQDGLAENVCYLEVRLAPQLHIRADLDVADVLCAVDRGLARAQREDEASAEVQAGLRPPFRYGLIACAMRMFTAGFSPYYKRLMDVLPGWPAKEVYSIASQSLARAVVDARDRLGLPVVGFDLTGHEAGHPAAHHVEAYSYAHQHFLKKAVNAGEAYGPQSIFQAITLLKADRIGHGTRLFAADQVQSPKAELYVDQLTEYIADRRITIEACVTSNMQTIPTIRRVEDHPVGEMIRRRLSVSLCTDNRLLSHTSATQELDKTCRAFDLEVDDLRNIVLHGFKRSFFPGTYRAKRAYVRQAIDCFDRVCAAHGLQRTRRTPST